MIVMLNRLQAQCVRINRKFIDATRKRTPCIEFVQLSQDQLEISPTTDACKLYGLCQFAIQVKPLGLWSLGRDDMLLNYGDKTPRLWGQATRSEYRTSSRSLAHPIPDTIVIPGHLERALL